LKLKRKRLSKKNPLKSKQPGRNRQKKLKPAKKKPSPLLRETSRRLQKMLCRFSTRIYCRSIASAKLKMEMEQQL